MGTGVGDLKAAAVSNGDIISSVILLVKREVVQVRCEMVCSSTV